MALGGIVLAAVWTRPLPPPGLVLLAAPLVATWIVPLGAAGPRRGPGGGPVLVGVYGAFLVTRVYPPSTLAAWAAFMAPTLLAGTAAIVIARRHAGSHESPAPWERRLHGVARLATLPVVLAAFFAGDLELLVYHFCLRYALGERMSIRPILYLRSFRCADTGSAFGLIVVRVARRLGVVIALAHQDQPPSRLHEQTPATDRAVLSLSPEDEWRDWIRAAIGRAAVVIVDRTVRTDSVEWELEQAISLAGPERVVILERSADPSTAPAGVKVIPYLLAAGGPRQARRALAAWMRRALV